MLTVKQEGFLVPRSEAKIVAAEVLRPFNMTLEDIVYDGPGARHTETVKIRAYLMWRLRKALGWSYPRIGTFLGRDHTTVIHAVRKVEKIMAENRFSSWYPIENLKGQDDDTAETTDRAADRDAWGGVRTRQVA